MVIVNYFCSSIQALKMFTFTNFKKLDDNFCTLWQLQRSINSCLLSAIYYQFSFINCLIPAVCKDLPTKHCKSQAVPTVPAYCPISCLIQAVYTISCLLQAVYTIICLLQAVYTISGLLQAVHTISCLLQTVYIIRCLLQAVYTISCLLTSHHTASSPHFQLYTLSAVHTTSCLHYQLSPIRCLHY